LALPAGKPVSAFADYSIVLFGQSFNKFMRLSHLGGLTDAPVISPCRTHEQIIEDTPAKQHIVLEDNRYFATVSFQVPLRQRNTVDQNHSLLRIEKTLEKAGQGCLPGTASADDPDLFSGQNRKTKIV
jgi:hypothetical protein